MRKPVQLVTDTHLGAGASKYAVSTATLLGLAVAMVGLSGAHPSQNGDMGERGQRKWKTLKRRREVRVAKRHSTTSCLIRFNVVWRGPTGRSTQYIRRCGFWQHSPPKTACPIMYQLHRRAHYVHGTYVGTSIDTYDT